MNEILNEKQAFILRMNAEGDDMLSKGLASNQIIIGWSLADNLLNEEDWGKFRGIVHDAHYKECDNYRSSGAAAGSLWRFIREMRENDLVLVPSVGNFYIARIKGKAIYLEDKIEEGTSYRRDVEWLNDKKPIPRRDAVSALVSRMKVRNTCVNATDLLKEIEFCAKRGPTNRWEADLKNDLVQVTLEKLKSGHIDCFRFEELLCSLITKFGGKNAKIIPTRNDKGADIVAEFSVVWGFTQKLAVQAKHFQPSPPVGGEVIDKLVIGMEAENADVGMVITTGTFSEEAKEAADHYEGKGIKVELVDGELLAKIIVESGFPDIAYLNSVDFR